MKNKTDPFEVFFSIVFVILFFAAMIFMTSCRSSKSSNSNSYKEVLKTEYLPGFNLRAEWPGLVPESPLDTIKVVDPKTGAELRLWMNRYNNLVAECEGKDTVKVYVYIEKDSNVKEVVENPFKPRKKRIWMWEVKDWAERLVILLVGVCMGMFAIYKLKSK